MNHSGTVRLGDWAAPLGSAVSLLLGPGARQQNDESAAAQLNVRGLRQTLPPGLSLKWLGTAGFTFACEGFHLVVDPYLTRAPLGPVVRHRVLQPRAALIERHVPHADAVLVGHTHFDHAMDVPHLARARGCRVYGSDSLRTLMGLHGMADACEVVEPGRSYALGPFEVSFTRSLHSKLVGGLKVNAEGEITCDHLDGMHQGCYRCGQVWGIHIAVAGKTFYHQGSANLVESELHHRGVDYLLCGIAGRGYTPDFTARVLRALDPQTVLVHHHDNFFLPLGAPMGFSFNVNFGGFVQEVRDVSDDVEVVVFEPLQVLQG